MKNHDQDELDYMAWVKSLGCYLSQAKGCGFEDADAHHVDGRGFENCDYLCIPLSKLYHTDQVNGIHGQRRAWTLANENEKKALAWVIKQLWLENKRLKEATQIAKLFRAG